MRKRATIIVVTMVVFTTALTALAQETTGIDPEAAIERAGAYAKDAADLVVASQHRLKSEAPEVKPLVDHALGAIGSAAMKGVEGAQGGEIETLINASGVSAARPDGKFGASHLGLMAFVSLSMPPDSLRKIMLDMQKAGGVVVFRGFPGNSMAAFKTQLGVVMPEGVKFHNIGIDPRLFEAFRIEAVPAYVAVDRPLELCKPLDCTSAVPDFDVLRGNVPVSYALQTFANGAGPGASLARTGLAQLEAQ